MASEWETRKIEEIAEKAGMGPFGSSIRVSTFVSEGIPVISGQHLRGTRLEDLDYNFITHEHADRLRSANVFPGDIIFTHAGNIGQVAYIPNTSRYKRYVISQRQFYMRCNTELADPAFVTYFFQTAEGQHRLLANSSPSGVPSIAQPVTYLRSIEIPLPPLPEQRAIAAILGALDDKIELNRRMNATLEATARALFKSWFVDFDPVRKRRGGPACPPSSTCPPSGLASQIADSFPDEFVDSELGEIPKGWSIGALGDVATHPRRGVQPNVLEPSTPYIALEHMPKYCIALTDWGIADELQSNKFEFKKGEILFGKLRPYFHKVGVAPLDGVCSTDIVVITPRTEKWFGFVLGHVSSAVFVEYTNAGSTGTKMPRTSWNEMARYLVMIPPETVAEAFTRQIRPLVDRIIAGIHESRTLATLRDTLLPKLLSGELRVPDAERICAEAGL